MWESFISRLTKELFTRQNSCNAPIEVFQYGIEICISTFATLFSIFILSYWLGMPVSAFLYLIVYIPLRITCGGYHANTYLKCFLISNMNYLGTIAVSQILTFLPISKFIWLILLLTSALYISLNAPITNMHHPIHNNLLKKNRNIAIVLLFINCSFLVYIYVSNLQSFLFNLATITIVSVAIQMLPIIIKRSA